MIPPVGHIMDVLDSKPRFSTLAMLLRQSGLSETLNGPGDFTLFAPTNEAFDNLDKYTLNCLAVYPEMLRNVLKYHVTGGKAQSTPVSDKSLVLIAITYDRLMTTE